jgi:TolB-like protein
MSGAIKGLLGQIRYTASHMAFAGAIIVLTGFGPEEWLHRGLELLHLPETVRHLWSTADARVTIVLAGMSLIVGDALWRRHRQSPVAAGGTLYSRQGHAERLSIAVLPFANMSGDATQEFFSDGMTEELTAVLSKVSGLHVVGRTSAFQFKGRNEDLRGIGQALRASFLIEGSVRKAADKVRITAQLIQADSGTHLWSESFDRHLTDVFAIQEEIARAIAAALQLPLGLSSGQRLVANRTADIAAYDCYLRALTLVRERRDLDQAISLLEQTVARQAEFAPAWALLGYAFSLQPFFSPVLREALHTRSADEVRPLVQWIRDKAETAAGKALELDPAMASGYATQATLRFWRGDWAGAASLYRRALTLDPDDPDAGIEYGLMLASVGFLDQSLGVMQQVRALEPLVQTYGSFTAQLLQLSGQSEASIPILEAMPDSPSLNYRRNYLLARAYAATGRFADAVGALLAIDGTGLVTRESVETAASVLRTAPDQSGSPQSLPRIMNELNFVYAYVGANERMLEFYEHLQSCGIVSAAAGIWDPLLLPMRDSARYRNYLRAAGLVEYWGTAGWPPNLRPMAAV